MRRETRYDVLLASIPAAFVLTYILAAASLEGGAVPLAAAAITSGVIVLAALFYIPPTTTN